MCLGSYSIQVLDQLIKTMTNLLMSNKREIVKSALGFFKVRLCNISICNINEIVVTTSIMLCMCMYTVGYHIRDKVISVLPLKRRYHSAFISV